MMSDDSDLTHPAVVRMFGTEELHRLAVDTLPKNAPSGKKNALVLATVEGGVKVALHFQDDLGFGTFVLEAAYLHQWSGGDGVGVSGVLWF